MTEQIKYIRVSIWAIEKEVDSGVGFKSNGHAKTSNVTHKNGYICVEDIRHFHESTMKTQNDTTVVEYTDLTQISLAMRLKEFEKVFFDDHPDNKKK